MKNLGMDVVVQVLACLTVSDHVRVARVNQFHRTVCGRPAASPRTISMFKYARYPPGLGVSHYAAGYHQPFPDSLLRLRPHILEARIDELRLSQLIHMTSIRSLKLRVHHRCQSLDALVNLPHLTTLSLLFGTQTLGLDTLKCAGIDVAPEYRLPLSVTTVCIGTRWQQGYQLNGCSRDLNFLPPSITALSSGRRPELSRSSITFTSCPMHFKTVRFIAAHVTHCHNISASTIAASRSAYGGLAQF
jgi:hypothetical protein